jgi:hypothetical protein
VVLRYEYKDDADGESTPYPLVQFQVPDGRSVTARTDVGGSFIPHIGEHVDVLFDPERPRRRTSRASRSTGRIALLA